jgi:low density lipoprotein-related protein 2
MDGTKRKTIVATGIGHPEALTIDFAMGHTLYWVDSKLNTLETMDHEGHKRHVLLRGGILRRPISVDVFENHIYWVNRDTGAVLQHDKFGRGVPVTIARNLVPMLKNFFSGHTNLPKERSCESYHTIVQ